MAPEGHRSKCYGNTRRRRLQPARNAFQVRRSAFAAKSPPKRPSGLRRAFSFIGSANSAVRHCSCPAATAAALEALHIIQNEPERFENLWDVTNYALKRFREEGFEIGETESPIIPLYVRDAEKTFVVTKMAYDAGVFINPVIPPACAPQDTLVRVALMATHTKEQVDYAVEKLTKCFRELGIIK